ncbi:MAG: fibronectin type III domain-containing protein [bacterium]|nr:fibronectin type III domain-containing protein [bacterium]
MNNTTTQTQERIDTLSSRIVLYSGILGGASIAMTIVLVLFASSSVLVPSVVLLAPSVLALDDSNSVTLTWTAPGDDGQIGQATQYDIRYSTSPISESNWSGAQQITNEPSPKLAGLQETFVVSNLVPKTRYYFALKATDESGNVSSLSNIANHTTGCIESWSCSEWAGCSDGTQNRQCEDLNDCGTVVNRPPLARSCSEDPEECNEDWICEEWSVCADGEQTRECMDQNSCGTDEFKPGEEQLCEAGGEPLLFQETYVVAAANAGGGPQVRVLDKTGELISQFFVYEEEFRGGVNIAVADLGGDGIDEIVVGPGSGRAPLVKVFTFRGDLVNQFFAYDPNFLGGVNVAAGELDGRAGAEIVTAPASNGGPNIRTFGYRNGSYVPIIENFFAYSPQLRGGVSVVVANIDGMGRDELLTVPSVDSGGPHVRMFNIIDGRFQERILGFFAYHPAFRGGVSFGTLDWNGDGQYEILSGPETRGGPHVRMFGRREDGSTGLKHPGYFVFHPDFRGGVSVAGGDFNYNDRDEWVVAVRSGDQAIVRILREDGAVIYHEFLAFPENIRTGVKIDTGRFFPPI